MEKGAQSFPKRLASFMTARIVSMMCGKRFTDAFCGLKAWRSDIARKLSLQEDGFCYEAEIIIKAVKRGYRVIEVPINYKPRVMGKSKIKFLYHMFEVPWRLLNLLFVR